MLLVGERESESIAGRALPVFSIALGDARNRDDVHVDSAPELAGATARVQSGDRPAPCYGGNSASDHPPTRMNAPENVLERHRWTVAEYRLMGESGALAPDARVELIEGAIVDMAPIGSVHAGIVNRLNRVLARAVGDTAIVGVQNPVELSDRSEPEPDLTLLRPRDDFYTRGHPGPANVLLVIEVADSTLVRDRDVKRPLYARHGIPEYWIVDVQGERLVTFRTPVGGDYVDEAVVTRLDAVGIASLDGTTLDLSGLFEHRAGR